MSLLTGPMRKHVNGHKELTDHVDVKKVDAGNLVYIPLVNGNAVAGEVLVSEGDKVKLGTVVARRKDNFIVPLFSSVSGTVKGKETFMHAGLKPVEHLVIENDGLYETEQAFEPIDYTTASREELCDYMMNAGIVGCGGAGFPSYVKYKFAKDVKLLIINAVECEPYITADYKYVSEYKEDLLRGVKAMLKMCEAPEAAICIKETKKAFIEEMKQFLKDEKSIHIKEVPDVYPMGWERTLVYEVTKKRYDRLPGEVGVVVNNATTAIAFGQALVQGRGITEKFVTVSGDAVKEPCTVRVPVGVRVSDIIAACGGYTKEDVLLIAGGPMMGRTIPNDQFVITPYSNALTVLENVPVKEVACLRCGRCSDHCPAGLQPVRINNAEKAKNMELIEKLNVMDCIECGMCTYICPSKIAVTEGVRRAKRAMALKKK